MVKINDPRIDRAGITLRNIRADEVGIKIKKSIDKFKNKQKSNNLMFNEDKLGLQNIDNDFYEDFINSSEDIKKELIFLWEEVYDLTVKILEYKNKDDTVELKLDTNKPDIPNN